MKQLLILLALIATQATAQQVPQNRAEIQLSFAPLVRKATPAVVSIYAKIMAAPRRTPLQRDPFFERFFRDPFSERPRVQNSLGSGVILSADGIVVSNYHVVGMATDIRVVTGDRREFTAKVLLGDKDADLAILRIDAPEDLPYLTLRASETVEVGELALAIGNPFGVGQTVSSGIISGLARSGASGGNRGLGYFIQTDAPINPGNSGGALIDMAGRLIGINTSILSRSGGSNGIGFAIPADLVAVFVAQARAGLSAFEQPWAGIGGQPVEADMIAPLGLERAGGIIIAGLHAASPFRAAGFAVGDVITHVGGAPVNTPNEMIYRMSVAGTGTTVSVRRVRGGETQKVDVALIRAPDSPPRDAQVLGERSLMPGLAVARINPAVIAEMNLSIEAQGVVITDPGPVAPRVGLRRGDVIVSVNNVVPADPGDIGALFSGQVRRFQVVVQRGDRRVALRFRA